MGRGAQAGEVVAILRADMAGSTEVLSTKGVAAAIENQGFVRSVLERVCGFGTLLEHRGDGSLVSFGSAVDALEAAWHLGSAVAEKDIGLRIAVTLEQTPSGASLSVEVEQRTRSFEARCPLGSILTDARIRRAVRGHDVAAFVDFDEDAHQLISFTSPPSAIRDAVALRTVLFCESASSTGQSDSDAAGIAFDCISDHGGAVVDVNGGQSMATFASCIDAIEAANALHGAAVSQNARADRAGDLSCRVAVSVGEIVKAEKGGFGIAVVEAARLVSMAEAGSTLLSLDVSDLAGIELSESDRCGLVSLKGLKDPVDLVRLDHDGAAATLLDLPKPLDPDHGGAMIGRVSELAFLRERHEDARNGASSAVVISGEEGVGKTRLVRELASVAQETGTIVLHGACENDPRPPFAPIADALSRAAHLDPDIAGAVREGAGPLGSLFAATRPTAESGTSASQLDLFGAVSDALHRLSVARPVLFVLDDIQWGSTDTLRLMTDVLKAMDSVRVLVVLTHRAEASTKSEVLVDLLTGTSQRVRRHDLPLQRLGGDEVVSMIESRTSSTLTIREHALVATISKITGGNPLYVDELLTHLITSHVLVDDPMNGWSLVIDVAELSPPESIIDLMARRIARLGGEACHLLGVAALMGSSFDLEVLAAATGQDIGRVLDAVEIAAAARLLRPADDEGSRAFSDEIARAAFLRHVRPGRKALVHEQLAKAIEQRRPDRLDELIVHWSGAIGLKARRNVIHYLGLATKRDLAAAAWESVVDRSNAMLALLDPDDLELQCETRLVLGTARRLLGEDSYRPELTIAADLARRLSDPGRLIRAAVAMMRPGGWLPEAGAVDTQIVEMCEDVLLLVNDPDDPIRLRALAALATNLTSDADPQRRFELVREAQERSRKTNDLRLIGSALVAELQSDIRPEAFERRKAVADEVRRIGRATNDADLLFAGTFFLLFDELERGAVQEAEALLDELRRVAENTRDFFSRYRVAYLDAMFAIARCEPVARERIDTAHQMAEQEPIDSFAAFVLQTGTLAMYAGKLTEMLMPIAQAAEMWDDSWSRRWDYALAKAYLDTGNHDLAAKLVRENPEPVADSYWLASYCQLAEVGWLLGSSDLCRRAVDRLTPFRGRFVLIGSGLTVSGLASVALGQAHLGLGNLDEAEELFREAMQLADRAAFPYFATTTRRLLAQTLLTSDASAPEATRLLAEVLQTADTFGFENEQALANELLAG